MKYFNIILGIIIIILIAVGAWFFFMKPQAPQQDTGSQTPSSPAVGTQNQAIEPDAFAINFYTWYLKNLINDPGFTLVSNQDAPQWLTGDFITSIEAHQGDVDPIYLAQDYQNEWATNVSAKLVSKSATESTVLITLGGTSSQDLSIHLIKSGTVWRIDSISRP